MNAQQLIDEANELPVEDRALLVDSLLHSLNGPSAELDQQWLALAQQRLRDLKSGKVTVVPAQEVFGKLWNRFDK
ncbi:addiction module protein [Cellvibrio sp. PSBB023]|uniref:addiction module protein n=1 Tax=Cellvibrio sp. PSBB023 TaxID=1945512 RepID=UPI00098EDB08|nr:addiction module protein [Cellvibrio sp. PSBB023]AQT60816.1 addiction module protein [Cellvibrio sp. PSBB023]